MQVIIVSLVTGFISTAIYAFWLQGREPQIKHSLTSATQSFLRKRRLRAYLSAIKGEFEVESAKRAVVIQIQLILALLILLFLLLDNFANRMREVTHRLDDTETFLIAKGHKLDSPPEPSIDEALTIKARLKNHLQRTDVLFYTTLTVGIPTVFLCYCWLILFRLPYVQRRSAFLVRLDKLRRILSVVCDTAELAEVLVLERRTSGEQSLREFADALVRIGKRHGLQEFVSDFELWPDSASPNHAAR